MTDNLTPIRFIDVEALPEHSIRYYDTLLPEGWKSWDADVFEAYQAYEQAVDPDRFECANDPFAAHVGDPAEEAAFEAKKHQECCGWHEEVLHVKTASGVVDLRVGFSHGH